MSTLSHYKIAFKTQWRVIFALILRETRVTYGSTSLGYLWAILEPLFGTILLVVIFSTITRVPPIGTNFALFFSSGLLVFQAYRKLASSLMGVFKANKGLMTYPLVKTMDVVYARGILVSLTNILIFCAFFGALIIFTDAPPPRHPKDILLAFFAMILLGWTGGLNNAVLVTIWPTWQQLEGILARPLFFISGVFFIPVSFPPEARYWFSLNPIMHLIEWFREAYYGASYHSVILDKGYLFSWIIILFFTGLCGERIYRKKITE